MARLSAILRRFSWTVGLLCDISPTQFDCCQQLMKSNLPAKAMSPPALGVEDLRCEFLRQPLAIETMQPRLSWVLRSAQRGQKQTAYQVLVAASRERLADDQGDFWNSGQVESDQSSGIVYAGQPLASRRHCFWKVRVWDRHGVASAWSAPATWTMGLLEPKDWRAQWIRRPGQAFPVHPRLAWIWYPNEWAGVEATGKLAGLKYFLKTIAVADPVEHAEITVACDQRYELYLNGRKLGEGRDWRTPACYDLAPELVPGQNCLVIVAEYVGLGPPGLLTDGSVVFKNQATIPLFSDGSWQVSKAPGDRWLTGRLENAQAAQVIGNYGASPWIGAMPKVMMTVATPSPWLRKTFELAAAPERALAYVNSLGYHELYVNGHQASLQPLSPALTDFRARSFYVTYDITPLLHPGRNCVGLWLGRGWFVGGHAGVHTPGPLLRFQAEMIAGGKSVEIVSDETWKSGTSPYATLGRGQREGGKRYDARLENPAWCSADYDNHDWTSVEIHQRPPPGPNRSCARRIGSVLPLPRWPVRIWEAVVTNWISVRIWPDGCG